jgi:AraC family transcriptional regulator
MGQAAIAWAPSCRPDTQSHRNRAVERVIQTMRQRLEGPLCLRTLARIAFLSPYHFHRIFRQITGIPPSQFLTALRLQTAKRLLLTTPRSVTDVCFDVGYNSLGSFITRFTQLVGRSPRHLRRLAVTNSFCMEHLPVEGAADCAAHDAPPSLCGCVTAPATFAGRVFVGLFPEPIPQGQPVACAVRNGPGVYHMERVPDGCYYLLAVGLPKDGDLRTYVLYEDGLRGRAGPVKVRNGCVTGAADIQLCPAKLTDPPILVTLPFLMEAGWLANPPTALAPPGGGELGWEAKAERIQQQTST